jgi:HK97 family phage prohead protease
VTEPDLSRAWVRELLRQEPARTTRFRASATTDSHIAGLATTWGNVYSVRGARERIERGAFAEDLARKRVRPLMWQADWSTPIGVATLSETDHGLQFVGELFTEDSRVRNIQRLIEAGAITNVSVDYLPTAPVRRDGAVDVITRAELLVVSLVLHGTNPQARLSRTRARR